jgi:hypothetical protein
MPLTELRFNAGVNRENTSLTNKGRWYAADKVRFRWGQPEKIGGWAYYTATQFLGVCRWLFNWITLVGNDYMAVGTNLKFYIEWGQGLYDITPLRTTFAAQANIFSFTASSASVKVTIAGHGASIGDFVTFSGVGGGPYAGITAAQLTGNFQVQSVIDVNNLTFNVSSTATATTANTGGAGITAAFEIPVGLAIEAGGTGWGAGAWGGQAWGTSSSASTASSIRLWSSDKFGQDLVFNVYNGGIYYLNTTPALSARAVTLATNVATDTNCPTTATWVCVTSARHMMIFGTQPFGSTAQDPMYIRWSDQENVSGSGAWTPQLTNQAGGIRLTDGSSIVTVKQTLQQILVWTNTALYALTYVGSPYIYSLQQVGQNVSIMSANSVASVGGTTVYWMGLDKFYIYNGVVNTLPCEVRNYVFNNINAGQLQQVFAFTIERFNEVWWLYPSANSMLNDSYVAFNYVDNTWTYGTMTRTAWLDTPLRTNPVAAGNYNVASMGGTTGLGYGAVGDLYYHEYGNDAGDRTPGTTAMLPYIESADMDIMEGEKFVLIQRLIPDVTFTGSTNIKPQCNITVFVRQKSGAQFDTYKAATITETANSPTTGYTAPNIEQFTTNTGATYQPTDQWVRLRGRQFKLRVDSTTLGTQWHLGVCQLRIQPDGKR